MFHVSNMLYFGRRKDGSVRILKFDKARIDDKWPDVEGEHPDAVFDYTVDANGWASIVASVSAQGETGDRYAAALVFHNGEQVNINAQQAPNRRRAMNDKDEMPADRIERLRWFARKKPSDFEKEPWLWGPLCVALFDAADALAKQASGEPVGHVLPFYGNDGTQKMVQFYGDELPANTKLYLAPTSAQPMAERVAQLTAHRACCAAEHDPSNGKLHGDCVVCGVPWPCAYAGPPPASAPATAG